MKLKATLLTLMLFVGIGLAGCSSHAEKSTNQDNKVENHAKVNDKAKISTEDQPVAHDDHNQTMALSSSKAKVKYKTVKFRAQLDDLDDSKLYKYVPGTRKNKTYSWKKVKAYEGKRIYVDKKATVYTRDRDDDDDDYDSEEYYRIRFSASNKATKYWVEEDVVDDDD